MQTLIKKIADKHLYRVNSNLLEDYSTNPIAPNDTSYVGFFFEKDVTQFPPKLREKYEAMKAEIDLKEAEYREKYGDDWRNIAVFNAYRGIKEEVEAVSEAKEIGNEMDDLSTEELRGLFKDWGGLKISYSRYYKTDNKGYYWYLVVRNYSGSNNFFPAILTFKPKPLGAGYFKDEMSLSGAKKEGYTKLESAKQIAANWGTGKKYDLMAESGNAESINETGMTKDVALHYAKITSLKVGNMMLFSHPELGYYTNPESDSEGAASLKKRGAKHVATASGGKLNFKMESLSEDHFSEKELTNMYSKFDKENDHDGLEAIEDYISAEADGNKAAAAKAAGKLKKLMKEDVSEAIKGWKNAHSDIAKARSEQGKNVVLHRLKNDGTESGMATARTGFSSEEEAIKQHENMVKLNPGKKIGHNLYVDGKFIKALGESVSDSTVKMSMPLFIRLMEWAFEECKDDVQIHKLAENLSEISSVADMEDYPKLVKEELDEALQGNWSVEKIQKLKPAQIKTLTANAKAANDKAVLDMIQVATAPKIKVQAPKDDPSKKVMPVDYYRVFDSLPDLDPADVIGMVSKKYSISDEDALKGLNRLAKQDKFKDYYSAVDSALKDYRKGLGEAYGDRKYGLKKTDADKAAKAAAIERAKDKLANLRKAHAEAEDAGDDAKADSLERQIKLAQADLGNIQAHG